MRIFSFIVLSFLMMIFFSSALLIIFGLTPIDNVYWIALSTPLVWVGAMFYSYWDENSLRVLLILSSITIICAVFVFISPVPQI